MKKLMLVASCLMLLGCGIKKVDIRKEVSNVRETIGVIQNTTGETCDKAQAALDYIMKKLVAMEELLK